MEFSELFRDQFGAIMATVICLAVFGYFYNRLVDYLHRKGWNDGHTWLEVVVGTAITLVAAVPTIGLANTLLIFLYFAASGFFMAFGDLARHIKARETEKRDKEQTEVETLVNEMEELND